MNLLNPAEAELLHSIHEALSCGFLDNTMAAITFLSEYGAVWILASGVMLYFPKTRKCGAVMALSLAAGLLVGNGVLKNVIARVRPYDFDESIRLLIAEKRDFSFPSGHTLAAFEGAVSVRLYYKKAGNAALGLAVLTAFSRVYLMMHYPTDVIAGAMLGTAIPFCVRRLPSKIKLHGKKSDVSQISGR